MTPNEWLANGEVGISSKTMWCALMGVPFREAAVPLDPDDFSRCWKLVVCVPEFRPRLQEVAAVYPFWKPYIDHWRELEQMYCAGVAAGWKGKESHRMYDFMQGLYAESRTIQLGETHDINLDANGHVSSIFPKAGRGGVSEVRIGAGRIKVRV